MASIVVRAGWSGLIRMVSGRLSEVGSSMSCVSCVWFGKVSIEFLGKDTAMAFRRFGVNLALVSAVAKHRVSRCVMSSTGAG